MKLFDIWFINSDIKGKFKLFFKNRGNFQWDYLLYNMIYNVFFCKIVMLR